ncbi:hypothetical protein TNCT_139341 [Trichonephila clavata]|uniref:Uncharacterized protein n=1 Tax=Trichonephila clavata TaxID=2740835 RepID=A0A8X6KJC1_TRICU|nr:hypothetical protein TNCT_139341 [Trichonephila clavata]
MTKLHDFLPPPSFFGSLSHSSEQAHGALLLAGGGQSEVGMERYLFKNLLHVILCVLIPSVENSRSSRADVVYILNDSEKGSYLHVIFTKTDEFNDTRVFHDYSNEGIQVHMDMATHKFQN